MAWHSFEVYLDPGENQLPCSRVHEGMSNESVITIEIRSQETPALEAAHRISYLSLSRGPCRLRRTAGEDKVQVLVYADVSRSPGEGGYVDPAAEEAGVPLLDFLGRVSVPKQVKDVVARRPPQVRRPRHRPRERGSGAEGHGAPTGGAGRQ